jgi:Protein of unknown function (DUF2569)
MSRPLVDPWDESIPRVLKGLGGLLLIPLLHLAATTIFGAMGLMARLKPMRQPDNIQALMSHPVFLVLTAVVTLVMLAQLVFGLITLIQFLRRKESVPHRMTIWYSLGIAVAVLTAIQFAFDPEVFIKVIDTTATSSAIGMRTTTTILVSGIFLFYFVVSKRVANTFVR